MKRLALAGLLGSVLVAGCTGPSVTAQVDTDREYLLEWIGERPLIDRSHLTLTLGGDGRAQGSAGCNRWSAPYALDGSKLTFGPAASTRKLCAEALMEQERRFLAALAQVQRWDFSPEGQLRLWPATGQPLRLWLEP